MRPVADDHPFLRWSHARDIDTSRVRLVQDDATGERAVVCADTDAIKADTVCLRVPFRACVGTSGLRCGATSCPLDDGAETTLAALGVGPGHRLELRGRLRGGMGCCASKEAAGPAPGAVEMVEARAAAEGEMGSLARTWAARQQALGRMAPGRMVPRSGAASATAAGAAAAPGPVPGPASA